MSGTKESINRRIRAANYLSVAQIYLKNNFLLENPLTSDDIKDRLLGHWGTCPGINLAYANLRAFYAEKYGENFQFILGPGHGFPALQANLFIDGELEKIDENATRDKAGIKYICGNFSRHGGFPSHASPLTPGVIYEGGELGYSLATAYGAALNRPEKFIAVLIGDGEFETATALASMNLNKLLTSDKNGRVLPILHLNGYKISAATIPGRKSVRELSCLLRGFGYRPIWLTNPTSDGFQNALDQVSFSFDHNIRPFIILRTEKGATGPITGYKAHQVPLKNPKTNPDELATLETWLKSYNFPDLFNEQEGFTI